MITLYQFPISHYCEKVRWALDYKALNYNTVNLLPGLHVLTTRRWAAQSTSVPLLRHDNKVIQNSSDILTYLDTAFPEYSLTPEDPDLQKQALAWEKFIDEEIGVSVRCLCYQTLLDFPEILIPMFTYQGPWYGKIFIKLYFNKLQSILRDRLDINAPRAEIANHKIMSAVNKINARLADNPYLVGNQFTRADLTAAALLSPIVEIPGFGVKQSAPIPEPLASVIESYREKTQWVVAFYKQHRLNPPANGLMGSE